MTPPPDSRPASSRPPFAVVLNPQAGRGLAGREWPRVERELKARGFPYQLVQASSGPDACAALARLPADWPALAVGGDGTAHGLLPELYRSGRSLGLVPLGSGNDLASLLGLRAGDLETALDRLTRPPQRLDLLEVTLNGSVGGQPVLLLNGLGMGFDAQVADLMTLAPARLLGLPLGGFPRYLWAALTGLRRLETGQLRVTLDGQPFYSGPSCLAAVMNGGQYGGGFRIAPGSDPQDGLLNVVLGTQLSRSALLPLMARVLQGRHLGHPRVRHARAQHAELSWQSPMQTHLDGELAGRHEQLSVRLLPGALSVLSGRP
ncbi:diacylglycerol/lipid kinase family protein [Deinococcus altitudinis]|uniref:diacylglycerol/lipid kinase family protein n=1 Tax=Deinococcus altitudinis TaxID=468914 RepID=UPI0038919005